MIPGPLFSATSSQLSQLIPKPFSGAWRNLPGLCVLSLPECGEAVQFGRQPWLVLAVPASHLHGAFRLLGCGEQALF